MAVCSFATNGQHFGNKRNLHRKLGVRLQYVIINEKPTIGINDREDMEIVSVNISLHICRIAVLTQQTICEVFGNLRIMKSDIEGGDSR